MGKLQDKLAIVTGATSGIGAATAKMFAQEGAQVILVGRNSERGNRLVDEIRSEGGCASFYQCDVSVESDVEELYLQIKGQWDHVDILFNNAGILLTSTLENQTDEDWRRCFATNVEGPMHMVRRFHTMMHGGVIINDSSTSGMESYTTGRSQYMYASSKAALIKFSKLCALNLAPHIRVNCICPGIIDTEIYTNRDYSRFNGMIPMERVGSPEEVAKVVTFLASDEASYITGAVIPIDGGVSLH